MTKKRAGKGGVVHSDALCTHLFAWLFSCLHSVLLLFRRGSFITKITGRLLVFGMAARLSHTHICLLGLRSGAPRCLAVFIVGVCRVFIVGVEVVGSVCRVY